MQTLNGDVENVPVPKYIPLESAVKHPVAVDIRIFAPQIVPPDIFGEDIVVFAHTAFAVIFPLIVADVAITSPFIHTLNGEVENVPVPKYIPFESAVKQPVAAVIRMFDPQIVPPTIFGDDIEVLAQIVPPLMFGDDIEVFAQIVPPTILAAEMDVPTHIVPPVILGADIVVFAATAFAVMLPLIVALLAINAPSIQTLNGADAKVPDPK